jgi:hypothetical protein
MPNTLEERDWTLLLRRIKAGKCTPFLGAGACYPVLPLGSEIAQEWAQEHDYPLEDCRDLARVAQFLAVQYDPMFPKEEILKRFENVGPPDFAALDEPHGVVADLPLPVYMTTNYDDFMVRALKSRNKDPKRELCWWNKYIKGQPSVFDRGFRPTVANPVVFHLHGHNEVAESLVLAEDDYLDFLVNVSRDPKMLPPRIEEALTGASLLFIGYRLADWSFRVLFRGLVAPTTSSLRRVSVTVQLPLPQPVGEVRLKNGDRISGKIIDDNEGSITIEAKAIGSISIAKEFVECIVTGDDKGEEAKTKQQEYLDEYFGRIDMRVYWGTAKEFSKELRKRWEDFSNGN